MELSKSSLRFRPRAGLVQDPPRSAYLWCLICERVYGRDATACDEVQLCPFEDCKGHAMFYSWDWNRTLRINPGYPRDPQHGDVYPLFGRAELH